MRLNSALEVMHHPESLSVRRWRVVELMALTAAMALLPWLLNQQPAGQRIPPFALLWPTALLCLIVLWRDPTYRNRELWNVKALRAGLPGVLGRFAVAAILLLALVLITSPEKLFEFPRRNPVIWIVVMLAYPIFSVYPQGIVMRAFFLHRYGPIFKSPLALIAVTAMVFSLMHLVMNTWQALALTLVGGVLFTWTHLQHRSLLLSSIEHALYGCWVFTVGLGGYIYHGSLEASGG